MKRLLTFLLAVLTVSCASKKVPDPEEDITRWQIYVSPKIYGVSYGSGAYEVYRCHYCNPEESMDAVIEKEIKATEDSILLLNSRKGPVKITCALQKKLDSLRWERDIINQAVVDFLRHSY